MDKKSIVAMILLMFGFWMITLFVHLDMNFWLVVGVLVVLMIGMLIWLQPSLVGMMKFLAMTLVFTSSMMFLLSFLQAYIHGTVTGTYTITIDINSLGEAPIELVLAILTIPSLLYVFQIVSADARESAWGPTHETIEFGPLVSWQEVFRR